MQTNPDALVQETRGDLIRRLLRQLIEVSTQALYSEQFDLEALVSRLSRNQGGVSLLRAYVAIQTAALLTEPLADADVDRAFAAVQLSEARSESDVFSDILETHRELAGLYWSKTQIVILQGELAHKSDEHSYLGTKYSLQHENKGPVTKEQRDKTEAICKELAELNRQIEVAELEAWKKQDEQEYHRYREELEARALRDEIDANEDLANELASAEVVSLLKAKLEALLHEGDQPA